MHEQSRGAGQHTTCNLPVKVPSADLIHNTHTCERSIHMSCAMKCHQKSSVRVMCALS